ncbi:hypothetical protein G7Y79_00006g019480 [Physcia stellaris]|nr:hypothetical protein G7Y79_00006g019480 [Physcia stellaris]
MPSNHQIDYLNDQDVASNGSDDSENFIIEPFNEYKIKIAQLLNEIGLERFAIEPLQHGYDFENCVYALTSDQDPAEQYILRVANNPYIPEPGGRCKAIENDVAVLNYLHHKLPVPRVRAYCSTKENVLELPYTVQTRIPGTSLNHLWGKVDYADKYAIVDQYLDLLVRLESITFPVAGTFVASAPMTTAENDYHPTAEPTIRVFDKRNSEPDQDDGKLKERAGSDIRSLFTSLLEMYTDEEVENNVHRYAHSMTPLYGQLLLMLEEMESEGFFADQPHPITLHHWDLEPRNLMVEKASDGAWRICGVIDWDDTIAVPRPLARKPPVWIWHFPDEEPESFRDDDQFQDPELSEKDKELKTYFDTKIEELLPGYGQDAYGRGRWLRRIWSFVREGVYREYERYFVKQLIDDWAARPRITVRQPELQKGV